MKVNFQEPRQTTIFRAVREYLDATNDSFQTFCMNVVEHYEQNTSPSNIEFSHVDDVYTRMERNAQKIKRFMSDDTTTPRFPAEMEESFVAALPEQYRLDLLAQLAGRYGLIATPIPSAVLNHNSTLADFCCNFAGVIETMGQLIADGTLENDSPADLRKARLEVDQLLAAATGWRARLTAELDAKSCVVVAS